MGVTVENPRVILKDEKLLKPRVPLQIDESLAIGKQNVTNL
jgi:hypothetical protein